MPLAVTASKSFSDTPDFQYVCPECNVGFLVPDQSTFNKIEPPFSKSAHGHEAWDPDWIEYRFVVTCVCNKTDCGEVAFVTGKGTVDQRYDFHGDAEYFERFTIQSFFPSPRLCYIPDDTPVAVETLLKKSFDLFWVDVSAAANSLRASLEALLNDLKVPTHEKGKKGGTSRMSLHRRLDVWSNTNKDHADLCYALKEVGNLGSHGDRVLPKHYFGSLEIYSHVLKELYENDAQKMKALAQSIQDDLKKRQAHTPIA